MTTKKIESDYQKNFELIQGAISTVAENLYKAATAKPHSKYGEAVKYLKQMDKFNYGSMDDLLDLKTRQTMSSITDLVIKRLYTDANNQEVSNV